MSIFAWMAFGVINSLILYIFEKNKAQTSLSTALFLGVTGAISGGTFAYALFGDNSSGLSTTVLLVVIFEIALLSLLLMGKSLRRI